MSEDRTEARRVEWRWWYGEGCIQAPGWDVHTLEMPAEIYDADEVAAEIVENYVNDNGTDGSNSFEIEIHAPAWAAGIYDVTLDWDPVAHATRRATSTTGA